MVAATVTTAVVADSLKDAVIFITGRGNKFVLESSNFRELQAYLHFAAGLPGTKEKYETEFPQANFEAFFKDDKELYTALQTCFASIHSHCADCKTVLIPAMITFANDMAAFATESDTKHGEINGFMTTATAVGKTLADPDVIAAFRNALDKLTEILTHAAEMKQNCEELKTKLSKFQGETKTDKNVLTPLHARFVKVIPEGQKVSAIRDKMIAESRTAYEQARETAEKNNVSFWTYFLSSLGTAGDDGMAGYNDTTAADNAILYWNSNACWKLCEESESNYKKTNENLKKAMETVTMLNTSLTQITKSIDQALLAIGKMTTAFSLVPTQFDKIKRELNSLASATAKPNEVDRRTTIQQKLLNVPATWKAIGDTAEKFALNGKMFE